MPRWARAHSCSGSALAQLKEHLLRGNYLTLVREADECAPERGKHVYWVTARAGLNERARVDAVSHSACRGIPIGLKLDLRQVAHVDSAEIVRSIERIDATLMVGV